MESLYLPRPGASPGRGDLAQQNKDSGRCRLIPDIRSGHDRRQRTGRCGNF